MILLIILFKHLVENRLRLYTMTGDHEIRSNQKDE